MKVGIVCGALFFVLLPVFAFNGISDMKAGDGQTVVITAEAIGNAIKDAGGAWLNLFDGQEHMSVYVDRPEKLKDIKYWGDFKTQGDTVTVSGTYNKMCSEHDITDVHMSDLSIHVVGAPREDYVEPEKRFLAHVLIVMCLMVSLVYFIKVRRLGKKKEKNSHARKA